MKYKLSLVCESYPWGDPMYRVIGLNYDSRKQAESAKRSYAYARSGIVEEAKLIAKAIGLRSPWKIDEYRG